MAKKRAIVSYDKLTAEQKREINKAFPDGYGTNMTQIITPTGETLDALIWETEETIYLVKIIRSAASYDEDDDEDEDDDIDDLIKPDDLEEDEEEEEETPKKSKKSSYDDDEEDDDDDDDDEE